MHTARYFKYMLYMSWVVVITFYNVIAYNGLQGTQYIAGKHFLIKADSLQNHQKHLLTY